MTDHSDSHTTHQGQAADLVMQMTMGVSNRQLEAGGVTAAHTLLMCEPTKLRGSGGAMRRSTPGRSFGEPWRRRSRQGMKEP